MVGRWELRSPLETTPATALGEPGDGYEGSAPLAGPVPAIRP